MSFHFEQLETEYPQNISVCLSLNLTWKLRVMLSRGCEVNKWVFPPLKKLNYFSVSRRCNWNFQKDAEEFLQLISSQDRLSGRLNFLFNSYVLSLWPLFLENDKSQMGERKIHAVILLVLKHVVCYIQYSLSNKKFNYTHGHTSILEHCWVVYCRFDY